MIIRQSEPSDTSAIIALLKLSLGEGLMKKSAAVWNFKHEENPFGVSHVLLADENGLLIGVRAFMSWRWQLDDKTWIAYRAVDTATHPQHQGKGVFKKLTLQAMDDVAQKSDCFIFNTPNDKSRPGYLKMGWSIVDAIPIAVVPTIGYFYYSFFLKKGSLSNSISVDRLEAICRQHNDILSKKNVIFTPKSVAYLKWRFEHNPIHEYMVVSDENWYLAMNVKKHRFFSELRVVEILCVNPEEDYGSIRKAVLQYAFIKRCFFITVADKHLFGIRFFGKLGPKLTFKPLTHETYFSNKAQAISNWKYSLGDLELF